MSANLNKHLILSFANLTKLKDFDKNNLILLTPSGIISGKIVSDEEIKELKFFNDFTNESVNCFIEETQESDKYPAFIKLKDVTFKNGAFSYSVPFITVFLDQIVGVTIGTL